MILADLEKKYSGKTDYAFTARYDIQESEKQSYRQALDKENFSSLYALAVDSFKPISEDLPTAHNKRALWSCKKVWS